jgi:hypothetical protein
MPILLQLNELNWRTTVFRNRKERWSQTQQVKDREMLTQGEKTDWLRCLRRAGEEVLA